MDYFKKRAKEILLDDPLNIDVEKPISLPNAYKNLKSLLRNPIVVHA